LGKRNRIKYPPLKSSRTKRIFFCVEVIETVLFNNDLRGECNPASLTQAGCP
jgi:hypothetical protein